jgi:hypothetical protein
VRKTINDITEKQERKKGYNDHGQKLHSQYVSEILHTLEIEQDTIKNNKSAYPENNSQRAVH